MSSSESEYAGNEEESNDKPIEKVSALNKLKTTNKIKDQTKSDEEQSDEMDERSEIRGELSTMSFEDLMKLKEELGSKVYNEAIFGTSSNKHKNRIAKTKMDFKRLNKNRPREMSSKRMVPLIGVEERQSKKIDTVIRDPRFDENCGDYNSKIFKENYSFINDIRQNEIDELKEKLKSTINDHEKIKIKFLIQRLENQNREEKARKLKDEVMKEEIIEINKAKREGKQPHYTTKKERRTKELVQQYEQLKTSGRLGKHLEKRRKKNTAKDRKKFSFD